MNDTKTRPVGLPAQVTRDQLNGALDALGLDLDSVQQVRLYPDRLRVRYLDHNGRGAYAWIEVTDT